MNVMISLLLVCLTIAFASAQTPGRRKPDLKIPDLTQKCLDCICQASSNCDETIKCHNSGGGGYFCGPYVISWAYWHDGGRPGDHGRSQDFETCLTNKTCAEEAVKGYMRKYGQDCDASGEIDCYDFARIHKLGFGSCSGDGIYNTDYWEKFEICHDGYQPPIQPNYDYGDGNVDARRKPNSPNYDQGY